MAPTPEQNAGMHDSLRLRANELLTSLAALPGAESHIAALSLGVIGELELHGATVLIEHGQLEDAERLLAAAADRPIEHARKQVLAEQWLRVARAWRARGSNAQTEAALRRAIDCGS